MGRATLAPRAGMAAEVPPLRQRPLATMKDMGMGDMSGGSMAGMDHSGGGDMGAMPMPATGPLATRTCQDGPLHARGRRRRDGGHGSWLGRHAAQHARLQCRAAGQARPKRPDHLADAHRPHGRAGVRDSKMPDTRCSLTTISLRSNAIPMCGRRRDRSTSTSPAIWSASCGRSTA